jgi:hypothetical protein
MAGTFPPDYFAPDYFTPEYFGGEVDANAISTAITGTATVTADLTAFSSSISASITGSGELLATISVTSAAVEDDDSGYWARVVKERRKKKLKARKPVPGVLAARIVGRSRLVALGEAPRVCWPCNVYTGIVATSALRASIEGPDRIAEQDEQDLQDLTDILMLLAA